VSFSESVDDVSCKSLSSPDLDKSEESSPLDYEASSTPEASRTGVVGIKVEDIGQLRFNYFKITLSFDEIRYQ
jgi:hypothetical protein